MNEKPTIVVHLCQFVADRSGRGNALPAHVRVAIHEPIGEESRGGFGPIKNKDGDFRWFLPAGVGMPQFFSENFKFEPQHSTKLQHIDVSLFEEAEHKYTEEQTWYKLQDMNLGRCEPTIESYYLGGYVEDDVVYDVVGFSAHDLRTRITTPGRKGTVAYMLNTAHGYASEAFFDFLHIALTQHGFTTLYVKPGAQKFQAVKEYDFSETVVATYVCLLTGQQMTWRHEKHDPQYHYPEAFLLSATKSDHTFALTNSKDLENSLDKMLDWKVRSQIAKDFVWIENDAVQLNGL